MKRMAASIALAAFLAQPLRAAGQNPKKPELELGKLQISSSPLFEDQRIKKECNLVKQDPARAGVLAPVIISWLAKLAINGWIDHLSRKLKEYGATYGEGPLWGDGEEIFDLTALKAVKGKRTSAGNSPLSATACFVFRRDPCQFAKGGACVDDPTGLEMIGQIRITETYSQLRPLAIHYVSTKAPAVKNAGVAISATVETLWVDGKVGQHVTSADSAIIASETLLINGKHEVTGFGGDAANPGNLKYYVDAAGAFVNWDMYPRFARIPADAPGGSNIGISVSVAEVGTPPKYLKALHRFVADNEGKLSPLLAEAIARQAGVELDE